MKKAIKCGIAAAMVMAAGFAAYQTYGAYGAQDNSLLMQNIEALSGGPEPEGDSGDQSGARKYAIVSCGYHGYATSSNRGCWHRQVAQCEKACLQFEKSAQLKEKVEEINRNKNWTLAKKREVVSQLFCTGPKTYFHLTEEAERRGYCINTKNY